MLSMMRVLMVGFDRATLDRWSDGLRSLGMRLDGVGGIEAALQVLADQRRDAVIVGPDMPDQGIARIDRCLQMYRAAGQAVLLHAAEASTACGAECPGRACSRRAQAVDRCAFATLLNGRLLRAASRQHEVLRAGSLRLDPAARSVHRADQSLALTPREFDLLHARMCDARGLLTRQQTDDLIGGAPPSNSDDTVGVHIHNLRRKIGADLIRTVRGFGYKLVTDGTLW